MDISIRIGGAAGQGIQTISSIIAKTFVRHGFYVFVNQDFASRIRGGHNFDQVRISNTPVQAVADRVHILIALNEETTRRDIDCLAEDGVLLFDGESIDFGSDDPRYLSVPLARIAAEAGKSKIMINAVATGATTALLDLSCSRYWMACRSSFSQGVLRRWPKIKNARRPVMSLFGKTGPKRPFSACRLQT
jgi:2-oxoglutarate ferredoxin oxidoreductase subunit alpha